MVGDVMKHLTLSSVGLASLVLAAFPVSAEPLIWGVQAEQIEVRRGESNENLFVWDFDALVGNDEIKLVWRSEAELNTGTRRFESLENQLRVQKPISRFFDVAAGLRVDTPYGRDRTYGVVAITGLAPQWFEIDAALYIADRSVFSFEAEYEALITNRLILTPSFEAVLPLGDDSAVGLGAWGPTAEIGARLSYDVRDRLISPYLGVHYERAFGETSTLRKAEGEDDDAFFFVIGTRILF